MAKAPKKTQEKEEVKKMKLSDVTAPVKQAANPRAWTGGVVMVLMLSAFVGIALMVINAISARFPQAKDLFWTPGNLTPPAPASTAPVLRTYGI